MDLTGALHGWLVISFQIIFDNTSQFARIRCEICLYILHTWHGTRLEGTRPSIGNNFPQPHNNHFLLSLIEFIISSSQVEAITPKEDQPTDFPSYFWISFVGLFLNKLRKILLSSFGLQTEFQLMVIELASSIMLRNKHDMASKWDLIQNTPFEMPCFLMWGNRNNFYHVIWLYICIG